MSIKIEEATRQGMIPLIGVYGNTGTGKTHSALLLARGLSGPDKDIGIIDTERKRSGALVGLIPGNFKRINLEAPFTPETYTEAIKAAEAAGWGCAVIDSMTHEWDGEGGILEMQEAELQRMAGNDYGKREACKMAAWIEPKKRHKLFVAHILRASIPLICCLRAQEKTHIDKKPGEKTKVTRDEFTTPIFDSRFIFEMLVNLETIKVNGKPGCAWPTKWTHNDLLKCLPAEGEQIAVEHGEKIAQWCAQSGTNAPAKPAAKFTKRHVELKKELFEITQPIHHGEIAALQQWLIDELVIGDDMQVGHLTETELPAVISKAKTKLRK